MSSKEWLRGHLLAFSVCLSTRGELREKAGEPTFVRIRENLRRLAADAFLGILANPALYAELHPELVAEYESVRGQARVVVWLMRPNTLAAWEGIAEPLVERLQSFLLY